MDNKNNVYKAIVGYLDYFDDLKGCLFRVLILYDLNNKVVAEFDSEVYPSALLEENEPAEGGNRLPDGVEKSGFYEVWVEDINSKNPLKKFKIITTDKFIPACLLYNAKWVRKKDNLFISTNGIVATCKRLRQFIPFDKEESLIYSRVAFHDGIFSAEGGVIFKYKLDNLDFLESATEIKKNSGIYVMSQEIFDLIEKWLIEEIDFIEVEQLKVWFIKSSPFDKEELTEAISKINAEGLDESAFKIRKERCRKLFESFIFSEEDLSWFFSRKNLKKKISEYKRNIEEKIKAELDNEKNKKLENLDAEVQGIIDDKRQELEKKLDSTRQELVEKESILNVTGTQLDSSRKALEEVKKELEIRRADLGKITDEIATMSISKNMILEALKEEIKNQQPVLSKKGESDDTSINDIVFFERGAKIAEVEDDNYKALFPIDINKEQRKTLADILSHRASVIPDVSYAYALSHFMTNTYLNIISVEHEWYHYENFVKAGVLDFYNAALADKEHNYLLVLENINIVPIECSFKPLVDLLQGLRPNIPGATELAFPNNLRILATVLPAAGDDAFGIKLNQDSYAGFHFVETPKSKLSMPLDRMMNTAQRYYVDLTSVTIDDTAGDNGYANYKDY